MKVKYEGKTYTIVERNCETIRIRNDEKEFCIHKDEVKPTDKEAKELLNG